MMLLAHYSIIHIFLGHLLMISTQEIVESLITLTDEGTTFITKNSSAMPLKTMSTSLLANCALECNNNIFCRTFIYDEITLSCQLYESDVTDGNITSSQSSTSRVRFITYDKQFYVDYNKTCDHCQLNRYLTCRNNTCQCSLVMTYWDGQICRNQLTNDQSCNSSLECRQYLNLTCVFGWCQSKPSSMFSVS